MGAKRKKAKAWTAVDLFAGCGGLTDGLKKAGFKVVACVEIDKLAASTYELNHPEVKTVRKNIRYVSSTELLPAGVTEVDLVAGCPPCQGFSRVRRRNRTRAAADPRNRLIDHFKRMVKKLKPKAVFLENVPGIEKYSRFKSFLTYLRKQGYKVTVATVDLSYHKVPQRRRRVVVLAGKGFEIQLPEAEPARATVRQAIGKVKRPTKDSSHVLHRVKTKHAASVIEKIKATPRDGGSRRGWPASLKLKCHRKCDGFKDVYGRMAWDQPATTITGGCINASKGRFLHPRQDRVITLFEAALLQTFRRGYRFQEDRGRYGVAEMLGNALPPRFARRVGKSIREAIEAQADG